MVLVGGAAITAVESGTEEPALLTPVLPGLVRLVDAQLVHVDRQFEGLDGRRVRRDGGVLGEDLAERVPAGIVQEGDRVVVSDAEHLLEVGPGREAAPGLARRVVGVSGSEEAKRWAIDVGPLLLWCNPVFYAVAGSGCGCRAFVRTAASTSKRGLPSCPACAVTAA